MSDIVYRVAKAEKVGENRVHIELAPTRAEKFEPLEWIMNDKEAFAAAVGVEFRIKIERIVPKLVKQFEDLTGRQKQIVSLLADGKTAVETAEKLGVSGKTIDGSRRKIFVKLGINSIAELTKYAIANGLTSL